ncbi:hypothetical protein EVAR_48918_1 [Eumeta japonica]|uniref:Uncharacterized protein n=1 Tax=Eumeta variegata TaxID=151549 RepID=A0A4C1YYN7_EUMVA|nr:hypothetical protein EVAR_48918_1 [Eumeta japonica]
MAPRAGPVKAAIVTLDSGVDIEEDQTLINEKVTVAIISGRDLQNWRCVGLFRGRQADRSIPLPREMGVFEARNKQNHPEERCQRVERVVGQ